jgi:hypothetical protein
MRKIITLNLFIQNMDDIFKYLNDGVINDIDGKREKERERNT